MTRKPKNADSNYAPKGDTEPKRSKVLKGSVRPNAKKNRWVRRFLYVTMVLVLFVAGLGMMFHQSITNKIVDNYAQEYTAETKPEDIVKNQEAEVSFDPSNVGALTSTDVLEEMMGDNHYADLPVIGAIAIPELGMNLPVMKGLDNYSLAVGAGTMKEGQQMGKGNYALASHSLFYGWGYESLLFTPLHRAQEGQTIYTRDDKNIYVYKTTEVFIVDPDAGYVTFDSEGEGIITLITCTDTYATQRIVVRGKLERQFPIKEAWPELKEYFGSDWTRWW